MEVDSPQRPSPMTTNTTAENVGVIDISSSPVMPALKRKSEERRHDGKENGDGDKRAKLDCEWESGWRRRFGMLTSSRPECPV